MIVAWIIEVYLNQLAELNELKNYDEFHLMHNEFYKFLDNNKIKVNEKKKPAPPPPLSLYLFIKFQIFMN